MGHGNPAGLSFGALLDAAQLMAPEAGERFGPLVEGPDGFGVGAIEHTASVAARAHEADVF